MRSYSNSWPGCRPSDQFFRLHYGDCPLDWTGERHMRIIVPRYKGNITYRISQCASCPLECGLKLKRSRGSSGQLKLKSPFFINSIVAIAKKMPQLPRVSSQLFDTLPIVRTLLVMMLSHPLRSVSLCGFRLTYCSSCFACWLHSFAAATRHQKSRSTFRSIRCNLCVDDDQQCSAGMNPD